jgi:hypothetical protein
LRSIESEARLNLIGRFAARADLTGMLKNRLLLERDRARHPEIAGQQIRRPLVITGMPRSGSTFLHGLLAQDPARRVPLHWELRFPTPPPDLATRDADPRIERARARSAGSIGSRRSSRSIGRRAPRSASSS